MIYNLDAEQSVLGALLLDNDSYDRIGSLEAEHFYRAENRSIFAEIRRLLEAGQPVDVVSLSDKLNGQASLQYVHDLAANTPSSANIGRYADIVRTYAQRRALAELARDLQGQAENAD